MSEKYSSIFLLCTLLVLLLVGGGIPGTTAQAITALARPPAATAAITATWTMQIPVSEDSYIIEGLPDTNRGATKPLVAETSSNPANHMVPLFRVDLATVPPGSTITNATLHLYVITGGGTTVDVRRMTTAWDELTVTWNNAAAGIGATPWQTFTPPSASWVAIDMTPLVQAWNDGSLPNYGVALVPNTPDVLSLYSSREALDHALHPYLELTLSNDKVQTVADDFDPAIVYNGNDGSLLWSYAWEEEKEGDGPSAGQVQIMADALCGAGNCLHIGGASLDLSGYGIRRELNLAGSTFASLEFRYRRQLVGGAIDLQISNNGGASWTTLATYALDTVDTALVPQSFDISPYIAANTQIRFIATGMADTGLDYYLVDDVVVRSLPQGVAGQVWDDLDHNAVRDAGEPGIAGVSVELYTGSCGDAISLPAQTAQTDASGAFSFAPLDAGDYCVTVSENTMLPLYTRTTDNQPQSITFAAGSFAMAQPIGYTNALATDQLTVGTFSPCNDITWLQTLALAHGATFRTKNFPICTFTFGLNAASMPAFKAAVLADPRTRYAAPDVLTNGSYTPNDPDYNDPAKVYGPQQIHADLAWDITRGITDVVVAVIDTGVDLTHPEFAGRLLPGWDYVNADTDPTDDNGHGTHVAGIAAAGINNGIGIAGMAGEASIMPIKVLNDQNTGWWSDVAAGITWAVDHGADVLNLSIGGTVGAQSLIDALAYAQSKNVIVVVAAGNAGSDALYYPASYDNVISVGATTFNGPRWSLSNYGPNVDVMAPGATVWSTYWSSSQGSTYQFMSGTSMASPHVAGVVALMRSVNPNLSPDEAKQILQNTAIDLGDPGVDTYYGYGLVHAGAAVQATPGGVVQPPETTVLTELVHDVNNNGAADPGDTVRYSIVVANKGSSLLSDVVISATVPAYTTYVADSSTIDAVPTPDETVPPAGTAFPLDEGGLNIGQIAANTIKTVSYDVLVGTVPVGVYWLEDSATVGGGAPGQSLSTTVYVAGTLLSEVVQPTTAAAGDILTYTVSLAYQGNQLFDSFVISHPLPAHTGYVAGSANAGGSLQSGAVQWDLGANQAGMPGTWSSASPLQAQAATRALASGASTLDAMPSVVTAGDPLTVTLTLTATSDITQIIPSPLLITTTNGVSVTLLSGPTPPAADMSGGQVQFTWVYRAAASSQIGTVTFAGGASGWGGAWSPAQSNSVIISPPLSMQVQVDGSAPAAAQIMGMAYARASSNGMTVFSDAPSNAVFTQLQSGVSGTLWEDKDGDALMDGGESKLAGVTVVAEESSGAVYSTTSLGDGRYNFNTLPAGIYTLTLSGIPSSLLLATTPYPQQLTLGTNTVLRGIDFGLRSLLPVFGDSVWFDEDGDGVMDVNEPGIPNVELLLYRDNGDNVAEPGVDTLVDSAESMANGVYLLQAPDAGTYFIDIQDPTGVLAGLAPSSGPQSYTAPTAMLTVSTGQIITGIDFGYTSVAARALAAQQIPAQGTIGDLIWLDADQDGIHQVEEAVLAQVEICATPTQGGNDICTLSDASGRYLLSLPADTYEVAPRRAPFGLNPTGSQPQIVVINGGEKRLDVDFGYWDPSLVGRVQGQVWEEGEAPGLEDGQFQAGVESGLAQVTVDVVDDADGDGLRDPGEVILASAITDASGVYTFPALIPGSYLFTVSDRYHVLRYYGPTVPGPNPGSDNNNQVQPYALQLVAGQSDTTADFGYRRLIVLAASVGTSLIGDFVWLDADADGLYNAAAGDVLAPGVTVDLYRSGGLLGTEITGIDGSYVFGDLSSGVYTVTVSDAFGQLTGYVPTVGPTGISDFSSRSQPYTVTLPAGGNDFSADFGYAPQASLSGTIFVDSNGNGTRESSETGKVLHIPVTIVNVGTGATYNLVADTGDFYLDGLLPGVYEISSPDQFPGVTRTTPVPLTVHLSVGQQFTGADIGYITPTAVMLADFYLTREHGHPVLVWRTAWESEQDGFVVWRSAHFAGPYRAVSGLIPASNEVTGASYRWVDHDAEADQSYWYRLQSLPDGAFFGPLASEPAPADGGHKVFMPVVLK